MKRRNFLKKYAGINASFLLLPYSNNFLYGQIKDNKNQTPESIDDFPKTTIDKDGNVWSIYINRKGLHTQINLGLIENGGKNDLITFDPESQTGMAQPAIAPLNNGCVIVFPVEQENKWRIAYSYVNKSTANPSLQYVKCEGTSNISPALATFDSKAYLVFESNAGKARGIYFCSLDQNGHSPVERLSSPDTNGYNPSIAALAEGKLFAAWDSFQNKSASIFGAEFENGKWTNEQQITQDTRIERHPYLATHNNEIWLTWQAQSYGADENKTKDQKPIRLNNIEEQRIVVAKLKNDSLYSPLKLFEQVSTRDKLLLRPRIAFDPQGNLWLSARQSIHTNAGWLPVIWNYSNAGWSEPLTVDEVQGRWRSVELIVKDDQIITSTQYDDLPKTWAEQGIHPGWNSGIKYLTLNNPVSTSKSNMKLEKLKMPETDFSLEEKITLCSAELPKRKITIDDKKLSLFFGDLHDHTDISVCARSTNPPGHDLYANLRDIEKLDFAAITDHGYNYDKPQWAFNGEQTRYNHDEGRFVTFLAEEWTSSMGLKSGGYGHHNLIFLNPYFDKYFDSFDDDITPEEVWKELDKEEFICIPHQLADWEHMAKWKGKSGNPPWDPHYVDEVRQPVAEIWQTRGSYEYLGCPRQAKNGAPFRKYYLQDAWKKKIIIGTIASPDHGGGHGKVGVWAEKLSRENIFSAIKSRHTYGTTGSKIGLLFQCENAIMGDKVMRSPATKFDFKIQAWAFSDIREIVIFRNNEEIFKIDPNEKDINTQWSDQDPLDSEFVWYYTRIHCADNEIAWSSPIWFV
ncbi:DUF3604 domain-containing protein [Bacteroidota bacterium]